MLMSGDVRADELPYVKFEFCFITSVFDSVQRLLFWGGCYQLKAKNLKEYVRWKTWQR